MYYKFTVTFKTERPLSQSAAESMWKENDSFKRIGPLHYEITSSFESDQSLFNFIGGVLHDIDLISLQNINRYPTVTSISVETGAKDV